MAEGLNMKEQYILQTQKETEAYLVNTENTMVSLLKLYLSVYMIFGPAITLLKTLAGVDCIIISLLFFIVGLLGLYILGMYLELRIRKIKTLEQVVAIREKIKKDYELSDWLKMINSMEDCPPYLRRPSSEWYTIIFLGFLNGVAVTLSLFYLFLGWNFDKPSLWPLIIVCLLLFLGQFLLVTSYAHIYDIKRVANFGIPNNNKFLNPDPYFPTIFKPFNWLARWHEKNFENWYNRNCLASKRSICEIEKIECPFCKILASKEEILVENKHFFVKWDCKPVSKGHALIIPKRHILKISELKTRELNSLFFLFKRIKCIVQEKFSPNGFNMGVNEGKVAGQTVEHLHIHLIPRYNGDVECPEGGVRNVIPGKGKYLT